MSIFTAWRYALQRGVHCSCQSVSPRENWCIKFYRKWNIIKLFAVIVVVVIMYLLREKTRKKVAETLQL